MQYSTNQDDGTATGSDQASWSASLEWSYKDLWLAVAHEDSTKEIDVLGGSIAEREAMRAALSWQLGATRLIGIYQQASHPRTDAWGAGLRHEVTDKLALKTHFYQLDATGTTEDAELFAVGVDYTLAKELMFYLSYGQMDNGDNINRDPWTQGRGDALTTGNGDKPDAVSAGAVYRLSDRVAGKGLPGNPLYQAIARTIRANTARITNHLPATYTGLFQRLIFFSAFL